MSKTLKYGSHDFPSKFGFSGSAGDGPIPVRGHVRKRVKMQSGGRAPTAVPALRPRVDVDPGAAFGGGPGIGSGSMSETERLTEAMPRGHAPLTLGGIAAALGNATAIVDPVKMGLMTGAERLLGTDEGMLGGVQNIPGWEGFDPSTQALVKAGKIRTMAEAIRHSDRLSGQRSPTGSHDPRGSAVDPGEHGPKGPGGTLGHVAKGGRVRRGVKPFNKRPMIKEMC